MRLQQIFTFFYEIKKRKKEKKERKREKIIIIIIKPTHIIIIIKENNRLKHNIKLNYDWLIIIYNKTKNKNESIFCFINKLKRWSFK